MCDMRWHLRQGKFWAWREEGRLTKQLGDASLSNARFRGNA